MVRFVLWESWKPTQEPKWVSDHGVQATNDRTMDFAGVFVSFFASFLFSDNQIIPLIVYCCYFMLLRCNVFQRAWYSALLIKVSGHVRICSIVMNFEGAWCSLCFFDKDDEGDGVLWVARGSVNSEIQGCLNSWAALSCLGKDEQGTRCA